jgi:predicted phage baseplate assembly protein
MNTRSDRDCCKGIQFITPRDLTNPPGLAALRYRIGARADFFQSMDAALSLDPALRDLTTRDLDDPSIAFLDAWATVADVLTFYQERIANEGYLRTATEFRSVLQLARLVGYAPRPGVSASTYLAFTLDDGKKTTITKGCKAQSVPEPGQQMQTFETSADLEARGGWNNLEPRRARKQTFVPGRSSPGKLVFLDGITTQLKPNDPLLLVFDASQEPFRVRSVTTDNTAQQTTVVLDSFSADQPTDLTSIQQGIKTAIEQYQNSENAQLRSLVDIISAADDALATLSTAFSPTSDPTQQGAAIKTAVATLTPLRQTADSQNLTDESKKLADAIAQLNDLASRLAQLSPPDRVQRVAEVIAGFKAGRDPLLQPYLDLLKAIALTLANLSSASTQADEGALATQLDTDLFQLRDEHDKAHDQGFQPLEDRLSQLIGAVEAAADQLVVVRAVEKISFYEISKTAAQGKVEQHYADQFARLKSRLHQASALELASSLSQMLLDLQRATLGDSSSINPKLQAFLNDAPKLLYDLIFAALRQILNRFKDPARAGILEGQTEVGDRIMEGHLKSLLTLLYPSPTRSEPSEILEAASQIQFDQADTYPPLTTLISGLHALQTPASPPAPAAPPGDPLKLVRDYLDAKAVYFTAASKGLDAIIDFLNKLPTTVVAALGALLSGPPSGSNPIASAGTPAAVAGGAELSDDEQKKLRLELVTNITNALGSLNSGQVVTLLKKVAETAADLVNKTLEDTKTIAEANRDKVKQLVTEIAEKTSFFDQLLVRLGDPAILTQFLGDALVGLHQEQRIVSLGGYPTTQPWLDTMTAELETVNGALAVDPKTIDVSSVLDSELGEVSGSQDLAQALQELFTRPQRTAAPVTLATSLGDSPSTSPGTTSFSDSSGQLLQAFAPELGGALYTALANAKLPRGRDLLSVQALRIKAAPFGATAPKIPIFGTGASAGKIIGYQEWPLVPPSERLRVAITPTPTVNTKDFSRSNVTIEMVKDGTLTSQVVAALGPTTTTPDTPQAIRAGSATGTISERRKPTLTLTFTSPSLAPFAVSFDLGQDTAMIVSVQNGPTLRVSDGVQTSLSLSGRLFRVSFSNQELDIVSEPLDGGPPPPEDRNVLFFDAVYDRVTPGSYVILERAADPAGLAPRLMVARAETVETVAQTGFGLSARVTKVTLDRDWLFDDDTTLESIRAVTVYAGGDILTLAGEPIDADVRGKLVVLDGVYDGLKPGKILVVAGERTDIAGTTGVQAAEPVVLLGSFQVVDIAGGSGQGQPHTEITLASPLGYSYKRATVKIYGNLVAADHGETYSEVLGNGDAGQPSQSFTLKQAPITFVAADNDRSGAADTVEARINGVLWHRAASFLDAAATERIYRLDIDDKGAGTVVFGDGTEGARLPTGVSNVRAVYRAGLGKAGNVDARQISQLGTRPVSVNAVVNPLPATGGADRESTDQARTNAATGTSALDRLVSVSDYADFARQYAGIAKASATRLADASGTCLFVTFAGIDDMPIDSTSARYGTLVKALREFGDPDLPVRVEQRERLVVVLEAELGIDEDYEFSDVQQQARTALTTAFGFDRRALGQSLYPGEVLTVLQGVKGVTSARLTVLANVAGLDENGKALSLGDIADGLNQIAKSAGTPKGVNPVITRPARRQQGKLFPAQLAYLSDAIPGTLILTEAQS